MEDGICLATAGTTRDAARIRSRQGRCVGAWLDTVPTDETYSLKPNEYRVASFPRLGVSLPFSDLISKCECRQQSDDTGYHLLTCKLGGGAVWQHDWIVSGWSELLRELHVPRQTEPKGRYLNNEDITAFNINSGVNFDLDIAMAHPFSKDIVKRASEETIMQQKRERAEKDCQVPESDYITLTGGAPKFVPLVFEHFGNWGNEADKFLDECSK